MLDWPISVCRTVQQVRQWMSRDALLQPPDTSRKWQSSRCKGRLCAAARQVGQEWLTCGVHKQNVLLVALGSALRLKGDLGRIFLIAALVERDAQAHAVRLQLLNCAAAEGVTRRYHHLRATWTSPQMPFLVASIIQFCATDLGHETGLGMHAQHCPGYDPRGCCEQAQGGGTAASWEKAHRDVILE